jgi:hypothetical protein
LIIREHSGFRLGWDALILALVLLSCVLIPYQLAFVQDAARVNNGLMLGISLFFLVDIGLNFFTSFHHAGVEVLDRQAIRRHYLRGQFSVDLLANVPLGLLLVAGDPQVGVFSSVLLVRLLGLLRLVRLFVILRRWEAPAWTDPGYLRVFKFLALVMVIIHWVACLWFALAYADGFPADSWVVAVGIEASGPLAQYVHSLYWTITTMTTVGYGDITPGRTPEYLLAGGVMLMGASLYAFIIGGVASLLSNLHAARNRHREHTEAVNQYLRARQVPVALGKRVHNYHEYLWHRNQGLDEAGLLRHLPRSLRLEILLHLARDVLQQVPLFQHCSPLLRDTLVTALAPATYAPGDYLARQGEPGQEIVFITRGQVEILGEESARPIATLGPGDYFGHLSLALREQRSGSVRAKGYCEVLILSREDYTTISADYPEFREVMKRVSAEHSEQASALLLQGVLL